MFRPSPQGAMLAAKEVFSEEGKEGSINFSYIPFIQRFF